MHVCVGVRVLVRVRVGVRVRVRVGVCVVVVVVRGAVTRSPPATTTHTRTGNWGSGGRRIRD